MLIKPYDNHAQLMVKITPGRNPGTHCGESWLHPGAGLRENGKKRISFLHRVSKPDPSGPQRFANVIAVPFSSRRGNIRVAGCILDILHYDDVFKEIGRIPYIKS